MKLITLVTLGLLFKTAYLQNPGKSKVFADFLELESLLDFKIRFNGNIFFLLNRLSCPYNIFVGYKPSQHLPAQS